MAHTWRPEIRSDRAREERAQAARAHRGAASAGHSLTGERTLPHIWHENYWFRRHEAAYLHIVDLIEQSAAARVLDAGCGEGYGSEILSRSGAERTVGLDYDQSTLTLMRKTYDEVIPVKGNLVMLPFQNNSFDTVVSLQVIEHIWEQERFVAECARVTRSLGRIVISTPNRLTFSPGLGRGEKPLNPFHVNEFDPDELRTLMDATSVAQTMAGLKHGPRIQDWQKQHGSLVKTQLAQPHTHWSDELAAFVASVSAEDFEVSDDDVDQSLDLIIVASCG